MLRKIGYILGLSAVIVLSGCAKPPMMATPSEPYIPPAPEWNVNKCSTTNWQQLGLDQGHDGKVSVNIHKIAEECAEHGIKIDTASYFRGLATKAQNYCTPSKGRDLGLRGQTYPSLCRREIYSEFYFEWYEGVQQFCGNQVATQPPICIEIKQSVV